MTKTIAAAGRAAARRTLQIALACALALGATGCVSWRPWDDTRGGSGLPQLRWLDHPPTGGGAISGTMRISDYGCILLEKDGRRLFVLWPNGFDTYAQDASKVQTDRGHLVAAGDTVTGTGFVLRHDDALKAGAHTQLGSELDACATADRVEPMDVVVLTKVTAP